MCGIAGAINVEDRMVISRMINAMGHRGPDGEGIYHNNNTALGHKRLSIIDIDGGKQPIVNEDGTLTLICNGEIYNSPELRDLLINKGHKFKTATDVEVILHLYEEYGDACVKHLRGMFAFAIWDNKKQSVFLARDHLGQKPLFFYHGNGVFLFASEVKSILASGLLQPEMDIEGLWHYMSLRFMPDQYSLMKNIKKLPAATSLWYKNNKLSFSKYWTLEFKNKLPNNEGKIEEGLHNALKETIKMHLLSDVRVGAFLSGGIDSTTIASMMAVLSETDEPIPTFSIGVKEQGFNELPYSRMVANKYGLEAHEKIVEANLIHLIPEMIYYLDEPADPFGVGVYLASQLASQHVKVVLSGDGADESFAGYDRYAGQRIVDYYCLLPKWLRDKVFAKIIDNIPESFGYKSIAQKARWVHGMSSFSHGERYAHSMSFLRFTQDAKAQLFTDKFRNMVTDYDSVDKILVHFNADNVTDLIDRMLHTDLMTRIPDHNMVIGDRMSMAHSLEVRSPFVDHKLVEYAASIPAHLKLNGTKLKYILRQVGSRYLPEELVKRKKQGFGFPLGIWMRTELKVFLINLFKQSRFIEQGIFNEAYVFRLLNEHLSGKVDHNYRIWILINLEIWYRLNFEGATVDDMHEFIQQIMHK